QRGRKPDRSHIPDTISPKGRIPTPSSGLLAATLDGEGDRAVNDPVLRPPPRAAIFSAPVAPFRPNGRCNGAEGAGRLPGDAPVLCRTEPPQVSLWMRERLRPQSSGDKTMTFPSWLQWLKGLPGRTGRVQHHSPRRRTVTPRRSFVPRLDVLEDRTVPS